MCVYILYIRIDFDDALNSKVFRICVQTVSNSNRDQVRHELRNDRKCLTCASLPIQSQSKRLLPIHIKIQTVKSHLLADLTLQIRSRIISDPFISRSVVMSELLGEQAELQDSGQVSVDSGQSIAGHSPRCAQIFGPINRVNQSDLLNFLPFNIGQPNTPNQM